MVVVTRISTLNGHQSMLNDAISAQAKLADLQKQISSGYKTDRFEGLFGTIEAFTALDDKIQRTDQYMKNNAILSARVSLMNESVSNVIDTVTEMRNIILVRRNGVGGESDAGFAGQLQQLWTTIAGEFNASVEGRYLFGGIRTDQPPVDTTFPNLFNLNNDPEDSYYRGATENTLIRLKDDHDVPITVRADDSAVQNVFAAFATALEGHQGDDDALLSTAYDLMSEGLAGLNLMQVNLATTQVSMDTVVERQEQMLLYWKTTKESLINTDLVAASTEVAVHQGTLQASFQAFARINQLNLANFLS